MMIPVRCFTCNACVAHTYEAFTREQNRQNHKQSDDERESDGALLDRLGVRRVCCRRMLLSHANTVDDILHYSQIDEQMDVAGTMFYCQVHRARTASCA